MLEAIGAFRDIPAEALARLERSCAMVEPRDGSLIFHQNDPADSVYAIVGGHGHVRIGAASDESKILMAQVFTAGDIFGEIGVIDGGVRTANAQVGGRVRLLRIPASTFLNAVHDNPGLGLALCRVISQRLRRTFDLLQDATFERLEVRLARQLLYLGTVYGTRTAAGLRLAGRFRQADLADLMGATPRSIISILNAWRADGLVAHDTATGLLTLRNEAALRGLLPHGTA